MIGFGAGEPDFPTPDHIVEAAVAACRDPREPPLHAGRRAARAARGDRRARPSATAGSTARRSQVLVTNGGKHAVFTAFAALCDPGDEVICPAPYWTTYPEAITLAGGVPKVDRHDRGDRLPGHRRPARGGVDAAHQGAAVRQPGQPVRRGVPARAGRGDRPVGRRAWRLGGHRRDLRAPHVRAARVLVDADARARPRRAVRRRQRRRQDVRDDRLAGRVDDRPRRCRQGGDQLPEPRDLERRQRLPAGGARRRQRRPRGGGDDAGGVRAARPHDALDAVGDRRRDVPRAAGRVLLLPRRRRACSAATSAGRTCTTTLELADHVLSAAKVAFVPGEAFGAPGYARFSFALGDEALVEGLEPRSPRSAATRPSAGS